MIFLVMQSAELSRENAIAVLERSGGDVDRDSDLQKRIICFCILVTPERQAAELSREDAIAALKRSGGDVDRALTAELGCFRLNAGLLEELAWEYALSR